MSAIYSLGITLAAAIALVLVYSLVISRTLGMPGSITEVRQDINNFVKMCSNDATMTVKVSYFRGWFRYIKYIRKTGDHGIEFVYPNRKRNNGDFERVKEICVRDEIDYEIKEYEGIEVLCIDFSSDVEKAYQMAKEVVLDVFRVGEDEKVYVSFNDPEGQRKDIEERTRRSMKRIFKN